MSLHALHVYFYYRCEHGILSTCYPSSELMPYKGSYDCGSKSCTISLREAAKIQQRDKVKCNCNSTCKRGRCSCRAAGFDCSSHCHPNNSACLNKESDDCVITEVEHPDGMSKLAIRKHKLELKSRQKRKHRKIENDSEASHINIRDREEITNHQWLRYSHIIAANSKGDWIVQPRIRDRFNISCYYGFFHPNTAFWRESLDDCGWSVINSSACV